MAKTPNGVILYRGPSALDGAPIVVIATGIAKASANAKTGAMIQTYILRDDMNPIEAVKTGADASICGDCVHRGDGTGAGRSCYVTLIHGPSAVYRGLRNGAYDTATPDVAAALFAGRKVRLGTYGDPAAAPLALWQDVLHSADGWTGYTHQWKTLPAAWARLVMASADTALEMLLAQARGFRTFRVATTAGQAVKGREVVCPASEEAGKKTECFACGACAGLSSRAKVSIVIAAHGSGAVHARKRAA